MKTNEILNLWKKYHEICLSYRNKPLPTLIKHEKILFSQPIEEIRALREKNREIDKKNKEPKQIIYIFKNASKFENTIQQLIEKFRFSREEIETNISFYDVLFDLPLDEAFDKIDYLIELLGSKENFLAAMRTRTPLGLDVLDTRYGTGILGYKRLHRFEEKIDSLSRTLSLTRDDANKVFVSDWAYIYNSSQTTREIINRWCLILGITPEQLGKVLRTTPCFLTYSQKRLQETISGLEGTFSLSTEEAINVILSRPDIVSAPLYCTDEILSNAHGDFPSTVSEKAWLYKIHEGIIKYHKGYDYGNYDAILKFFEHVENTIGEITGVEFEKANPRIKDGVRAVSSLLYRKDLKDMADVVVNKNKEIYTTLIVKKRGVENQYCFVSFGSGYKTCNRNNDSFETLLTRAILGKECKGVFAEFIVDAPPPESEKYEEILWRVFAMSSTGNITPCNYNLKNGTSIVVEELESYVEKFEYNDVSCIFRTLDIIPTSEIEKYRNKYKKHFPQKFDDDFEDLNDFDDDYDYEEYVFEEEDDE